jgi:hypothetical protein
MDAEQEKHEREHCVCEQLINWYNQRHGTSFRFQRRPDGNAPDNYYSDGNARLRVQVEVTEAFYDEKDAMYKRFRKKDWGIVENFTQSLVNDINSRIAAKCMNSYGANCLLAVYILADMNSAGAIELRLNDIIIPTTHRFEGIYLCGDFLPPPDDKYISGVLKGTRPPLERRVWQLWANEPIG